MKDEDDTLRWGRAKTRQANAGASQTKAQANQHVKQCLVLDHGSHIVDQNTFASVGYAHLYKHIQKQMPSGQTTVSSKFCESARLSDLLCQEQYNTVINIEKSTSVDHSN